MLSSVVHAVSKVIWDPYVSGITRTPRPLYVHRAEFLRTSPHYTANLKHNEPKNNKQRSKYIWRAGIQYLHDVVRAHLDVHLDALSRPDMGGEAKATCLVEIDYVMACSLTSARYLSGARGARSGTSSV